MSFQDKVSALRRFFGVPEQLELGQAVDKMNGMMGIVRRSALPGVLSNPLHRLR